MPLTIPWCMLFSVVDSGLATGTYGGSIRACWHPVKYDPDIVCYNGTAAVILLVLVLVQMSTAVMVLLAYIQCEPRRRAGSDMILLL